MNIKENYKEIVNKYINKTDNVIERLKKENKLIGLDTNKDKYELIHKEYSEKLKKLKERLVKK